jgi:hypothetical protein
MLVGAYGSNGWLMRNKSGNVGQFYPMGTWMSTKESSNL